MSTDTYENVRRAIAHHDFATHAGYLAAMRLLADYDTTRDASWAEYCENAAVSADVLADVIANDAMAITQTSEQRAAADAREDAAAIFALMVTP